MRRQLALLELAQRHDLEERRDAADARRIGLDEVGAGQNQLRMLVKAGQHFAGRDRGVKALGQQAMALEIVRVQRLLDPGQIEVLQGATGARGLLAVPLLIGVDHQRKLVAEQLAHGTHALDVDRQIGLPDLQLDAANAAVAGDLHVLQHLIQRRVQIAARGVVALHGIALRAQQLGQRQAGALGFQVPQGDVKGRDGLRREAAAAHAGTGPQQLGEQARDVVRVLTDQVGRQFLGVRVHAGAAGALGVAKADAFVAIARADLGKDEGDLGQRLLPPGQHLGVADRCRQRQGGQRQLDPVNAVTGFGGRARVGADLGIGNDVGFNGFHEAMRGVRGGRKGSLGGSFVLEATGLDNLAPALYFAKDKAGVVG